MIGGEHGDERICQDSDLTQIKKALQVWASEVKKVRLQIVLTRHQSRSYSASYDLLLRVGRGC